MICLLTLYLLLFLSKIVRHRFAFYNYKTEHIPWISFSLSFISTTLSFYAVNFNTIKLSCWISFSMFLIYKCLLLSLPHFYSPSLSFWHPHSAGVCRDKIFHLCYHCLVWQSQNNNPFRPNGGVFSTNWSEKCSTGWFVPNVFVVDVYCLLFLLLLLENGLRTHTNNIHIQILIHSFIPTILPSPPPNKCTHIHNNLLHAAGALKTWNSEKLFLTTDTMIKPNAEKRKSDERNNLFSFRWHMQNYLCSQHTPVQTQNLIFTILLWDRESCRTRCTPQQKYSK